MKPKIKKKLKKNRFPLISVFLIFILFFINIGYSVWIDRLKINGNITLAYKEPPLSNVTIVKNSNGEYTQKASEGQAINSLSYSSSKVTNTENILEIYGEYEKYDSWIVIKRTVNISFSLTNNNSSALNLVSSEIISKSLDYDVTLSPPTTINSGETANISMSFEVKGSAFVKSGNVKCKFAYKIGEITKYLYYTINIV